MKRKILKYLLYTILLIVCFLMGAIIRYFYEESKGPEVFEDSPLCHVDSLKIKVINKGDIISYIELRDSFMASKFPDESLFYSIVMAKQYGYQPANKHVCQHFKSFYEKLQGKSMDSFTDSIYHMFLDESKLGVISYNNGVTSVITGTLP